MTRWRRRFRDPVDAPEEAVAQGERCSRCLERVEKGDVYGVLGEKTLCVWCADDEWAELTGEEKLEILGYEVIR